MIVGDIRWGLWGRTGGPYGGAVRWGRTNPDISHYKNSLFNQTFLSFLPVYVLKSNLSDYPELFHSTDLFSDQCNKLQNEVLS